ncbi:hypothetical protein ACFXOM_20110 [Streptomyces sp. NPDC059169]|uniref:hypothetical protein n=1 Tax=unclassified Streptomyces TaxID=2593676 RepID=UPI0036A53FCD
MTKIEQLIPEPARADRSGLREVDVGELLPLVLDRETPWWRREPCATALAGRVPEARVPELIGSIHDASVENDVREALIEALSGRVELLPWLMHEDRRKESHRVYAAVLKARATLGDRSALPGLSSRAGWPDERVARPCKAGLDALLARYGLVTLLVGLDEGNVQDRIDALRVRHHAGEDVTDALADPERTVACTVAFLRHDEDRLRAYLDRAPTVEAKLWAVCALYWSGDADGEEDAEELYNALGRVEVAGLDEEVRRAILHEYLPDRTSMQTDPRWRLESFFTEPPAVVDEVGQLRRATQALIAAGLSADPPVSAAQDHGGNGFFTYHAIGFEDGRNRLLVSTLGPYVACEHPDRLGPAIRQALESAGFLWIDSAAGSVFVDGLHVSAIGGAREQDVHELLFFWID